MSTQDEMSVRPYMSEKELNRRYDKGCPIIVLAELNGCTPKNIFLSMERFSRFYDELEELQTAEDEYVWLVKNGCPNLAAGKIMRLTDTRSADIRKRHGLESGPRSLPKYIVYNRKTGEEWGRYYSYAEVGREFLIHRGTVKRRLAKGMDIIEGWAIRELESHEQGECGKPLDDIRMAEELTVDMLSKL